MKTVCFAFLLLLMFSCGSAPKDFVDLPEPVSLQSPEIILEFEDKYPASIKVADSLLFVIYAKADTCIDIFNIPTKQKIASLGPVGHGADDLINPNFILSADNDKVLLEDGNLKKIVEIKHDADSMRLKEYIPYPAPILTGSEINFSENYIVGRKINTIDGKMFFIYHRTTEQISEVNCPLDLQEPVSDYNYVTASTIAFCERQNRIIAGMYFFDRIHVCDLEGRHIHTFRFSEKSAPDIDKETGMPALGNGYSGFVRCFPTEKYCYLLRITVNPAKETPESMLIQTDWNGNPVNSYRFADKVSGQFYIDECLHKIYIIRNSWSEEKGEVFDIVSYNLQ